MNSISTNLTVIIPFLNESSEVRNTVANLRDTATENVDILLINDCSNDGYNYKAVAEQYHTRYVEHKHRIGVAASRDEGVSMAKTDYILLLDGHMRFPKNGWDVLLMKYLSLNPRIVWCGNTLIMNKEDDGSIAWKYTYPSYGAYMELENEAWGINWNYCDPNPEEDICDIPCLLGACYAFHKSYWQKLMGLKGLQQYGLDEQFLSYKVWMEGGSCKLIKSLQVGHLYRKKFPYRMTDNYLEFNRLFMTELLLEGELRDSFRNKIIRKNGIAVYMKFANRINNQAEELEKMRERMKAMQQVSFEEILEMNYKIALQNKISQKSHK
jgi:glycosyltransferase involved in cell wall biosynthesis